MYRRELTATPELRWAMNATMEAAETLELFHRVGIYDECKLAPYRRRLEQRQRAEQMIRQALNQQV